MSNCAFHLNHNLDFNLTYSWFFFKFLPNLMILSEHARLCVSFANSPGDLGSIPDRVIPKTQKMVLDTSLLNTQHYKVRIKGKVEQSRERSSALPLHLGVVAIEKGAFGSPSTMVAYFTLLILLPDLFCFVLFCLHFVVVVVVIVVVACNETKNR